jgi:hypothetical protein
MMHSLRFPFAIGQSDSKAVVKGIFFADGRHLIDCGVISGDL